MFPFSFFSCASINGCSFELPLQVSIHPKFPRNESQCDLGTVDCSKTLAAEFVGIKVGHYVLDVIL